LVSFDLPPSLDGLIELTSKMERCIQVRREICQEGGGTVDHPPACESLQPPPNLLTELATRGVEPMQVGRTSLTPEERE